MPYMDFPINVEAGAWIAEDWECTFEIKQIVSTAEPYSHGGGRPDEVETTAQFILGDIGDVWVSRRMLIRMISWEELEAIEDRVATLAAEQLADS